MRSRDGETRRINSRRLDYLADKECEECGEDWTERLTVLSRDRDGKLPDSLWQLSDEKREKALANSMVVCRGCRSVVIGVHKNLKKGKGPRAVPLP